MISSVFDLIQRVSAHLLHILVFLCVFQFHNDTCIWIIRLHDNIRKSFSGFCIGFYQPVCISREDSYQQIMIRAFFLFLSGSGVKDTDRIAQDLIQIFFDFFCISFCKCFPEILQLLCVGKNYFFFTRHRFLKKEIP